MQKIKTISLFTVLVFIGFAIGWGAHAVRQPKASAEQKWEFADALPPRTVANCVPANSHELAVYDAAATAIELEVEGEASWMGIGAKKLLASNIFRNEGKGRVAVCVPPRTLERVLAAFTGMKRLDSGRLTEYQLELAWKLPRSNQYVVDAVAQSAFNSQVQPSDTFHFRDIRPYARTILASFGTNAKNYSAIAYEQMSDENPMGTGAAQVAAATQHPMALERIDVLMQGLLSSVPNDRPIPRELRNRLYELSWAIYFAGESGKKYTEPIHAVMRRRVESWAPPFGMVDLHPKQLCKLIVLIEGADAILPYKFCLDEKVPYDQ